MVFSEARARQTAYGQQMFDLIVTKACSEDEIIESTGLSKEAIVKWRTRLFEDILDVAARLEADVRPQKRGQRGSPT